MLGVVLVIAAVAVIVGVCLWYIAVVNRFRVLLVKIEETDSGIEVALTKRYDLLTKMVALCRKYAEREAGTLSGLVELRRRLREEERDLVVGREQRQRVDGALRVEEEGGAGGAVVGREAEAALQRDALGVSAT